MPEPLANSRRHQTFLKRYLLIFSERIFDSRVEAGTPSIAAAPESPETLPPVVARAFSIASFSWAADFLPDSKLPGRDAESSTEIQLGSTEKASVSQTMTDRSITF